MQEKDCVILKLCGGQGNQMFQYAAAYTLAKQKGVPLYFEISRFIGSDWICVNELKTLVPDYQEVPDSILVKLAKSPILPTVLGKFLRRVDWFLDIRLKNVYIEKDSFIYEPEFFDAKTPVIVSGYFSSEKYFIEQKQHTIDIFSAMPLGVHAHKIAQQIKKSKMSIGLHYRDYTDRNTSNDKFLQYAGLMDEDFYHRALEKIIQKNGKTNIKPTVFVFSDGIENAKKLFANSPHEDNIVFVDYPTEYNWEDMKLMSLCDHNIIANSTYSWWGAYLNQNPNKVICAHKTFGNMLLDYDKVDIFPENWILLN